VVKDFTAPEAAREAALSPAASFEARDGDASCHDRRVVRGAPQDDGERLVSVQDK